MNDGTPTQAFLDDVARRIDSGELILDDDMRQRMVVYRRAVFRELLSLPIGSVEEAFHKLIFLFSVEAICVELQLMPFADGLMKIGKLSLANTVLSSINTILGAISCVAICTYVIRHW